MNLGEFFECMAPETMVVIEWNGEEIFLSKMIKRFRVVIFSCKISIETD